MATISELAAEAGRYLRREAERGILLPLNGAPEWFTDLCRTAHAEMFPDDWRYEFIGDALAELEEDDSGDAVPDLDSLYPYTADRLRWLSSRVDRTGYCDAAMTEYGCQFTTTDNLIALGMQSELTEVFGIVRQFLEERVRELEEETEAATEAE